MIGWPRSRLGDPPARLKAMVGFERFRPILKRAACGPVGPRDSRPALDPGGVCGVEVLDAGPATSARSKPRRRSGSEFDPGHQLPAEREHSAGSAGLEAVLRTWHCRHGTGCAHAVRMSRTGKQRGALIRADVPDALLQEPDSAINQAGVISRAGQNEPLWRHWCKQKGEGRRSCSRPCVSATRMPRKQPSRQVRPRERSGRISL